MTKLGGLEGFVYWNNKEIVVHNTERHKIFKEELYPLLSGQHLSRAEKTLAVENFKKKHPELFEE